jgi:hypothetical protein
MALNAPFFIGTVVRERALHAPFSIDAVMRERPPP